MERISVIIPCYNVERYIVQCVESVIRQSYPPCEIICINDGSSDNTLVLLERLCKEYPSVIKIIDTKNNGGSAARNLGLKSAKGAFIQFLDADDIIVPEKFEKQIKGFDKNVDFVVSDWLLKDNSLTKELKVFCFDHIERNPLETAVKQVISTCNPLYRTNVVKKIEGYDTSLLSAQDWDFHIRMILAGARIKYVPGFFFIARKVGGSISSDWIKVSIQATEIIIKLEPELIRNSMMNREIKNYISQLFMDSAIYSKSKSATDKYISEVIRWSEGDSSFVKSKLKRLMISIFGIGSIIKLQKLKNKFF